MRIDAHHHLWTYSDAEYPWMRDEPGGDLKRPLRRDYGPAELAAVTGEVGVNGTVVVQARQSIEETDWLLSLSEEAELIRGVVGWAPLAADDVGDVLDRWAGRPALKGVRHVVQDEPDGFLDDAALNRGVAELHAKGLVYDVLIYPRQLAEATRFVDRHPETAFVLDHAAKPRIGESFDAEWASLITKLAERPHVACKLSGLATEVRLADWDADLLRPYVDVLLDAFGPDRLLWGSDWPVALMATGYGRWLRTCEALLSGLSESEREAVFGGTARRAYSLA